MPSPQAAVGRALWLPAPDTFPRGTEGIGFGPEAHADLHLVEDLGHELFARVLLPALAEHPAVADPRQRRADLARAAVPAVLVKLLAPLLGDEPVGRADAYQFLGIRIDHVPQVQRRLLRAGVQFQR